MLLVYNHVLLKMSTWYSKHVEESNNIWRINNIQCITLVVLYGRFVTRATWPVHLLDSITKEILADRNYHYVLKMCTGLSYSGTCLIKLLHALSAGPYLGTLRPWAQEILAPPPFVRIQLCSVKFPSTVNQFNNTCISTRYQHCFQYRSPLNFSLVDSLFFPHTILQSRFF